MSFQQLYILLKHESTTVQTKQHKIQSYLQHVYMVLVGDFIRVALKILFV